LAKALQKILHLSGKKLQRFIRGELVTRDPEYLLKIKMRQRFGTVLR